MFPVWKLLHQREAWQLCWCLPEKRWTGNSQGRFLFPKQSLVHWRVRKKGGSVCCASHQQFAVSVRDVTSGLCSVCSYHREIEVSVCQLDPCCDWFLQGSSAQQLPPRSHIWRVFVQVTRTPSFHSFLSIISFLHSTFDPPTWSPLFVLIVCHWEAFHSQSRGKEFCKKREEIACLWMWHWRSTQNSTEPPVIKHTQAPHAAPLGTRLLITRCGVFCTLSLLSWLASFLSRHQRKTEKNVLLMERFSILTSATAQWNMQMFKSALNNSLGCAEERGYDYVNI